MNLLALTLPTLVSGLLVGVLISFFRREVKFRSEPDGRIVFDPDTQTTYCRVCQQVMSDDQLRCPYCG
jgi:uncharacterized paraquat-inducible protein A